MHDVYEIAIIGAGPAGIGTAIECYALGMRNIIMIEKEENHNSTIRKFYKDDNKVNKEWQGQKIELNARECFLDGTKESTLDCFDALLDTGAVELRTHCEVQKIVKHEQGFEIFVNGQNVLARNVVITVGSVGTPNKPDYDFPPSIRHLIHCSLDSCGFGEKIMVVGGGDTAVDYAIELCDRNDVTICHRGDDFTRANSNAQANIAKAIGEGRVVAMLNTEIIQLEAQNGRVKMVFSDGYWELCDRLVYAIGGIPPSLLLQNSGVKEKDGLPMYDENYQTSILGLFVSGDITQELGGSIALGLNHGFIIATYIRSLLK